MAQRKRRRRWNRVKAAIRATGMVAAFVVLTAGSLGMAISGNPIGWAGLLLFGGGGLFLLAGWVGDLRRRRDPALAQAPSEAETWPPPAKLVRHDTLTGAEKYTTERHGVLFPTRRSGLVLPIIAGLLFTGIGVTFAYVAFHSGLAGAIVSGAIALVCLGFFFPLTVVTAVRLVSPAGGILALPEGIYLRASLGTAWLPWPTVSKVALDMHAGQPSIAFTLKPRTPDGAGQTPDPARQTPDGARLSGPLRLLRPLQRSWFRSDIAYPAMPLSLRPDLVATLLDRLRRDPELRSRLTGPDALDALDPGRP